MLHLYVVRLSSLGRVKYGDFIQYPCRDEGLLYTFFLYLLFFIFYVVCDEFMLAIDHNHDNG